jgi:hypothetical protein
MPRNIDSRDARRNTMDRFRTLAAGIVADMAGLLGAATLHAAAPLQKGQAPARNGRTR